MLRVIREIQPSWVIGENVPGIIKLALEDICTSLEGEGYAVQPFIIPSTSVGAWDKRDRVWIIAYNNQWRRSKYRLQARRKMPEGSNIKVTANTGLQRPQINEKQAMGVEQYIEVNPDTNQFDCNNAGYNTGTISQQQKAKVQFNSFTSDINGKGLQKSGQKSREQKIHEKHGIEYSNSIWKRNWIEVASELCGSNARVSNRMERIKALGNSVNPYVVFQIFKAIEQLNESP
jgi:DNA (cytosine-5)-methyltransferase 1